MIFNVATNNKNELIGVLSTGQTEVTLVGNVNTDSTIDIYTDVYGVNPTEVTVNNGYVVLTFDAQESDVNVKVRVS